MRILVIEDEPKVARALKTGLERAGYQVALARTGEEGFFAATTETFDLVLLDLMLPVRDGLEILSAMRGRGLKTPVLILTARDAVDDRVQGLDSGADDYLMKPFAQNVVLHLSDLAEDKGQQLEVEARGPVEVLGDWLVLRVALVNVLDNAIKYSPDGKPIRVRVGRDGNSAWVSVSDQGPGIAAEDRDRIFERFYRVDKARSREQGGAGLGLSLAKWGVETHHGRIELETEVSRGSTFRIVLPARTDAEHYERQVAP